MDETVLYHHGILGQRWGVRRYQNKDGSLTSAGKKRYTAGNKPGAENLSDEELASEVKRMNLEKQYNKLTNKEVPDDQTPLGKAKKIARESENIVNQVQKIERDTKPKKEKLDLSDMSDQELRDAINRANLERQYNDLFAKEADISNGRRTVEKILSVAGPTLAVTASALEIAIAIKKLGVI